MAITKGTMTDEQRKSVALEYLKAFDNSGVTSTGDSILELFADDAQVYFPKWGLANGKEEIGQLFGDVGETIHDIPTIMRRSTGSSRVQIRWLSKVPASVSTATVHGGPVNLSGPRAGGAMSSRSATSKYSAALST